MFVSLHARFEFSYTNSCVNNNNNIEMKRERRIKSGKTAKKKNRTSKFWITFYRVNHFAKPFRETEHFGFSFVQYILAQIQSHLCGHISWVQFYALVFCCLQHRENFTILSLLIYSLVSSLFLFVRCLFYYLSYFFLNSHILRDNGMKIRKKKQKISNHFAENRIRYSM